MIATLNAARVPLDTVAHSVKVMELAALCARDGNLNAISDAMSAWALARATLTAAGYNVKINLNSLEDKAAGETMLKKLRDLEKKADKIEKEIQMTMEDRGGIS
jgi:formiminotetrahydrofolate cyclodeaminase